MNSSRYSRLLLSVLVVLSVVAVPVAAVSVQTTETPEEARVGTQISGSITLHQLYKDPDYQRWTLAGSTALRNVTWTVTWYDQADNQVNQQSYDGQNFSDATVSLEAGHAKVVVTVTGTVPPVENFTYDPPQAFQFVQLRQARKGGTSNVITAAETHHFTESSNEAREELNAARQAIQAAKSPEKAKRTFQNAVDAYNSANFDLAIDLANEAERQAERARQSQRRTQLLLYAGAGIVVLALLVGGVLYWRSRQESYDKLG